MKKNKILPLIVFFLCSTVFLSACTKPAATSKSSTSNKNIQGNITIYADENDTKYLNTAINSFISRNNNAKIKVETLGEDEIVTKYMENYGKEDQGDIVIIKEEKIKEVLSKYEDKFLALDENKIIDKSNLIEDKCKNLYLNNSQYGTPWYVNPVGMLYRKDILASVNLNADAIKSWQDYISAGDIMNTAHLPKLLSINVNTMNYIMLTMLQQLTTNFNSDNSYLMNSENVLKVGSTIKTLIEKESALQVSSDQDEINKFINGETVSAIVTSRDLKKIEEAAPDLKDKIQFEKIPAFENGGNRDAAIRGSGILINNNSNNQELAIAFMNYLTSDYQSMKELYDKYRLIPAHYIIYASSDFSTGDDYYGNKLFDEEIEIVEKSYNYEYTSEYEIIRKALVDSIKASSASKEDMKLTLDKLQNNINDIVTKASAKN